MGIDDSDDAAVRADNGVEDREPEPTAATRSRPRTVDSNVALEDALAVLVTHARSVVTDLEHGVVGLLNT